MNLKDKKARVAIDLSFRRHHARVTAQLLARFGADHLDIIEEALLAAFARAMETWPYQGVPDNPGAWLTTTAGHKVIDTLRKSRHWSNKVSDLLTIELDTFDEMQYHADMQPELRLMFLCCIAEIDPKDQMILILKFLCGFDNEKIAFVFMSSVLGIDKRISRCRKRMKTKELPELKPAVIASSSPVVKRALYLLFNEGYHSGVSEDVVKTDVCDEAIRLTALLLKVLKNDLTVHALLALMYLHRSRLQSKIDELGHLVLLQDQDRSLWDRSLINKGLELWRNSLKGWQVSQYHNPSSTVVLNRLIAKSQIKVDKQLLGDALQLKDDVNLKNYPYLYSFLGDLYFQMDDKQSTKNNYQKALQLCRHASDRQVVENKIAALD